MDSPATQPMPLLQPPCPTPWFTIPLRVLSLALSWMEQQWSLYDEFNYSSTTYAPTSRLCSRYSAMTKTQLGLEWLLAELHRQQATAWDLALFCRYWTNAGAWVKPPFLDFSFFGFSFSYMVPRLPQELYHGSEQRGWWLIPPQHCFLTFALASIFSRSGRHRLTWWWTLKNKKPGSDALTNPWSGVSRAS